MQAAAERPRLREDLLAEQVNEHGATFIDVMDPDSGSVFRFFEVEFSLACAMDGERDVPGLVRWAEAELGVSPAPQEVHAVIATLGQLGYLDLAEAARAAAMADAADSGVVVDNADDADAKTGVAHQLELAPEPSSSPDVSLDLADHIAVGMADVQEAVRQSRVMAAVEVPKELLDEVPAAAPAPPPAYEAPVARAAPPAAPPVGKPAAPAVVATPVAERTVDRPLAAPAPIAPPKVAESGPRPAPPAPAPKAVEPAPPAPKAAEPAPAPKAAAPAPKVAERSDVRKPAVELPKAPEKQAVVPPAPASRTSPALIVFFILVVLGAGAFAVWKFVLQKSNGEAATGSTGATTGETGLAAAGQPPLPEEPKRPPAVTSKIELAAVAPKPVVAPAAGVIEWIEASGKDVKANDVVAKLRGAKALEVQVAAMTKDLEKRTADLKTAQDALKAVQDAGSAAPAKQTAAVAALEKVSTDRTAALAKKTEQLEPLLVRLAVDGTLTVTRKVGEKLAANAELGTVQAAPDPAATFKLPEGTKLELAAGAEVKLRIGEHPLTCAVAAESEPGTVRVTCPKDPAAVEGAAVTWQLP